MKKIMYGLVILIILFLGASSASALQFHYGEEIPEEYMLFKKSESIKSYFNLRYIYDDNNRVVFCIQPSSSIKNNINYNIYENSDEYPNLTKEQLERIKLIIFYGYGNPERRNAKWFSITQFKIWETILSPGYVSYTNENRVDIKKYESEMEQLEKEIKAHYEVPTFIHDYTVNYQDSLRITDLTNEYDIISNNVTLDSGYFNLSSVTEDTTISVRKKITPRFNDQFVIYESLTSQDLITPGDVSYPVYTFNINVKKGKALIDVKKIDDVYTIESDFSNTCYEITREGQTYDSFCTNEETTYETAYLPYGNYDVKQTSHGIGYREDTTIYHFTIDDDHNPATLSVNNYLIRNTIKINKYYCQEDTCLEEKDAIFEVYDKANNLVNELITDDKGFTSIELGYGNYLIKQKSGLEGYTLAESFNEVIKDEESDLSRKLYNYYIEPKPVEEIITPPSTGHTYRLNIIAILTLIVLKKVLK